MTIGERIKQRRLELGLTQTELANRLGNKSRVSVCTVEKDKEDLTIERIKKYAKALEVSPTYLMGFEKNTYTPSNAEFEITFKLRADIAHRGWFCYNIMRNAEEL